MKLKFENKQKQKVYMVFKRKSTERAKEIEELLKIERKLENEKRKIEKQLVPIYKKIGELRIEKEMIRKLARETFNLFD